MFDHRWHSTRSATLSSVAAVIGVEAAVRLSALLGGVGVQIPHEPNPQSELALAIGLEAAQKLGRAMGGTEVFVPLGEGKRFRVVMLRVVEELTVHDIALKLGCSERFVFKTLAEHAEHPIIPELALPPKDANQGDLFAAAG